MKELLEKFKALPVRTKIIYIAGAVIAIVGIIYLSLCIALSCSRSAFEEEADVLAEAKAKELGQQIKQTKYTITKSHCGGSGHGGDFIQYDVKFENGRTVQLKSSIMPTELLDTVFGDYEPSIYVDFRWEVENAGNTAANEALKDLKF